MKSSRWGFGFGATLLALLLCAPAWGWPDKPVKIVVPFAPGGATDVVSRLLGQKLSEVWKQSVVVENRAGAGGNVGADLVTKAPADGYTLLMTSGSIVTVNPHLYTKMPFNADKDLLPITNVAQGPMLIAVNPALPVKNLKELIAYAKANPGKLNMGSAGIGTQTHMVGENFAYAAGISFTHVPYRGEGPAWADLVGGQINLITGNLAAGMSFAEQKRVRPLAVTGPERTQQLPDVPTASQAGVPGFVSTGWFGLMAPAGTPEAVLRQVYQDTAKVLDSTEMRARLFVLGMTPVANTPVAFAKQIRDESVVWAKVVSERKLKQN